MRSPGLYACPYDGWIFTNDAHKGLDYAAINRRGGLRPAMMGSVPSQWVLLRHNVAAEGDATEMVLLSTKLSV